MVYTEDWGRRFLWNIYSYLQKLHNIIPQNITALLHILIHKAHIIISEDFAKIRRHLLEEMWNVLMTIYDIKNQW
jgi:hypothetical protein